jgi:hypothetical protein
MPTRHTAKRRVFLESFDGFVTSTAAPIATGWSDPDGGWDLHPLKNRAFSRRTDGAQTPTCLTAIGVCLGFRALNDI